jgi:hypothetical protein
MLSISYQERRGSLKEMCLQATRPRETAEKPRIFQHIWLQIGVFCGIYGVLRPDRLHFPQQTI